MWRGGGASRQLPEISAKAGLFGVIPTKAVIEAVHPVLGSRDVSRSIRFFEGLDFTLVFQDSPTDPRYAAVTRDRVELHLQWHDAPEWVPGVDRPTIRFLVRDVDGLHAELSRHVSKPDIASVMNTAWGTREFHVRDPDGNGLHFYWPV